MDIYVHHLRLTGEQDPTRIKIATLRLRFFGESGSLWTCQPVKYPQPSLPLSLFFMIKLLHPDKFSYFSVILLLSYSSLCLRSHNIIGPTCR